MPPAISLLANKAPPAMARYQLRLKRRNGRYAAKVLASSCFILMPLKNASGSQSIEQIECQKLSRTESLLMNASSRSYKLWDDRSGRGLFAAAAAASGVGMWRTMGAAVAVKPSSSIE